MKQRGEEYSRQKREGRSESLVTGVDVVQFGPLGRDRTERLPGSLRPVVLVTLLSTDPLQGWQGALYPRSNQACLTAEGRCHPHFTDGETEVQRG